MTTAQGMPARLAAAAAIMAEAAGVAGDFFTRRAAIATRTKNPQDFVSEADVTVERLIRDRLAAHFPGEAIVGEELGGAEQDSYWVIDPIDGTSNFLRGSPLWGLSLGYVTAGRPEIGVIALPIAGGLYAAATGAGLYRDGQPFSRVVPFADVQVVSLGDSPQDDIDDVAALNSGLRRAGWVVEAFHSTSISMIFAAIGIFDGHLQKRTTMWDIAGGAVICQEAGLDLRIGRDVAGHPWVATGTPKLMAAVEPLWPAIGL